jgi:hypothetical protein
MRTASHIGLSVALLVAPALCCCNPRWMAAAATGEPAPCPTCPAPAEKPAKPTGCQQSCGRDAEPEPEQFLAPSPSKAPPPSSCCCVAERPVAAHTEAEPEIPTPEFTGLLPGSPDAPEHAGLARSDPPERAGVDARSAALFDRHVMRC